MYCESEREWLRPCLANFEEASNQEPDRVKKTVGATFKTPTGRELAKTLMLDKAHR